MLKNVPAHKIAPAAGEDEELGFTARVLVVDDEPVARALHRALLSARFDVLTAASGEEALAQCEAQMPDLVLLDVDMPGVDGYETCRRLRAWTNVPIIFVTGHENLDVHLKAYDAGGNDLITKPVNEGILLRKVALAIRQYWAAWNLADEKAALQKLAMDFLSNAGQTSVLLNFMRASIVCADYDTLADQLLAACADLGVHCSVLIRFSGGAIAKTGGRECSPLEVAILENAAEMGRVFEFRRRLVVNYERVSLLVIDMPDESVEPERVGLLRDSLAILTEMAETLCVNVDLRQEGQQRAEQLQVALSRAEDALNSLGDKSRAMQRDTRLLLQDLVDGVEKTYSWLGTTVSQEAVLSETMGQAIQRVLECLAEGGDFDAQFAEVMQALSAGRGDDAVELF